MLDAMAVTRERVAEQLLALRKLHGAPDKPLSQEKAAQRAGVSARDWQRWETKRTTPHASSLGKVADGFDIPLDAFDDGKPNRSGTPLADRLDELDQKLDWALEILTGQTPQKRIRDRMREAAEREERRRDSKRSDRREPPAADQGS